MKTVLITGGTKGIGKAIALKFLQQGYGVILNYSRDEKAALETKQDFNALGYNPLLIRADVSSQTQVKEMFKKVFRVYGKLDVLVNNAGVSLVKLIQDVSLEDWERVIGVNLRGVFLCCREVTASMVNAGDGSIINIASVWGEVGASCETVYSASKGAVIAFTKALAKELAPSLVRVNCVSPGVIDTEMNSRLTGEEMQELISQIPLGRLGTGEDVANACLYLAENDYVTGEVLSVGGGFAK